MKLSDLYEDYCSACGGWDKEQQGRGHNLGCPAGESGTPIAPGQAIDPETEGGLVEGWFDIGDIEHVYSDIKGYGGTIMQHQSDPSGRVHIQVMFDNKKEAEGFASLADDPHVLKDVFHVAMAPIDLREMFGPKGGTSWKKWGKDTAHDIMHKYITGSEDAKFVRDFDLS